LYFWDSLGERALKNVHEKNNSDEEEEDGAVFVVRVKFYQTRASTVHAERDR
jgi:hypothetical protein